MIGKRIFQLIIHTGLVVLCITSIPALFEHRVNFWDVAMAICILGLAIVLAASVRLNWILLKNQRWAIKLPPTSSLQFLLILLSPIIVYLASSLGFSYDNHLSFYSLYVDLPEWLWLPKEIDRFELGIAGTAGGICMFLVFVFLFMLIVTIQTLGLWSNNTAYVFFPISRILLSSQFLTSSMLLLTVLFAFYEFNGHMNAFILEGKLDMGLLNTWNLGCLLFEFLNVVLLLWYATWVLADSIYLWKINKTTKAAL